MFSFHDGKYRVLILKLDCMVDKIHDSDNNLLYTNTLQFRYRDAIVNMLLENCYDVLSAVHDSCVYFICNYDRNINDMVFLEGTGFNIHNLARALDEENIKYDFMHLSIAVGDDVDNLDEINKSVKGAKTALNRRIIPTQSSVIIAQQIEPDKNDVFTRSEKELVSMSVTSMSEEDLYSFIEEKVRFLRTSNRSELLYMLASSIVAFVKNVVAVNNLLDMDNEFFKIDIDERVDNCFTDGMIVSCLKTYLGEMFEEIRNLIAQRSSKALRTALTYIDNNYNQQITLQDVAEQVYYSPNYLGSIIKKETGHTFLEYLTNIRIRKAEELLRNSHYTIGKIATMVGYNDEKYFSQLFAKTTGIKPFEYRKFYS